MRMIPRSALSIAATLLVACGSPETGLRANDESAAMSLALAGAEFNGTSVRITGQRVAPGNPTTLLPADSKYLCNSTFTQNNCFDLDASATAAVTGLCPSEDIPLGVWSFAYQLYSQPGCTGTLLNPPSGLPYACFDSHDVFSQQHPNATVAEQLHASDDNENVAVCLTTGCTANAVSLNIASNFNGIPIPAGYYIWFNSLFVPPTLTTLVHVYFRNGLVTFTAGITPYAIPLPDAVITLDPAATTATTTLVGGKWLTRVPTDLNGGVFLTGYPWLVPTALPGGISPVTVTGTLTSDASFSFTWRWAAAVYTQFPDAAAPTVKAVDDNSYPPFPNNDRAGTPENDKAYVTTGARGNGATYTGAHTAPQSLTVQQCD